MNTKENQVLLLYSTDPWHTNTSYNLLGVFSNWNTMVANYLNKFLSPEEIIELKSGQIQGRSTNYVVDIYELNPIYK